MSPVSDGPIRHRTIVVHDRIEPPVTAGDYELRASQTIGGDPDLGTVPDDVRYVRVTAPRYRLPSTEILSTFPPANSDGPFVTRLAQVALKRRTLPWERSDNPQRPWLALVLLTDGEGTYLPSVPVASAVTEGVRLTGDNPDGPNCAAIEVTRRVVREVFPSRQELPFTCHVREVPLDDTELAQGDDDGWVAVVLGTRLPRPGMRYRACLISLEGQWSALPDDPPVQTKIDKARVYEVASSTIELARQPRTDDVPLAIRTAVSFGADSANLPKQIASVDRELVEHDVPTASIGHAPTDAWSGGTTAAETSRTGFLGVGHGDVILDVDMRVIDPGARLLRFPVLASWEFRCEGDKDFEALVRGLDVGLLGTVQPPMDPAQRVPAVSDTGHVVLDATERGGDASLVWYRGPFVPRAVERRAATAVHVADQLRRIAEDGRIELGEAAAFELGRLLALSAPSTVAALREWRRQGFVLRRSAHVGQTGLLGDMLSHWDVALSAVAITHRLVESVGDAEIADRVLPTRPLVDPLPALELLKDPAATIASGLGVRVTDVRTSLGGVTRPILTEDTLAPAPAAGFDAFRSDAQLLQPVSRQLTTTVATFTAIAQRFVAPGPGVLVPHGPDEEAAAPAPDGETVEELFPSASPGEPLPEPEPPPRPPRRRRRTR